MPDLLASTSLLPLTPAIPGRAAPIAVPGVPAVADFMAMLGELVLPPGAKPQGGKGQALAGDGKDLPVEGAVAAGDEEEGDPLVAWLPAGLVPITPPEPVPISDVVFVATSSPHEAAGLAAPMADIASPAALPAGAEMPNSATGGAVLAAAPEDVPAAIATSIVDPASVEVPTAEPTPLEGGVMLPHADVAPEHAPRGKVEIQLARTASTHAAVPQPVVPGAPATQTAAQAFAAAISASFDSPAAPAMRLADPVAVQIQASAASEQLRTTVQAMSGADQPPLDLSRDDWAGKMIDRIATLRDAAEAADTRIRLAPENLGNVDVSIRRDGDRLHVHFAAENPTTRQLLADAAPRLAELADARGVKLGQTSVDAGAGGQHQSAQSQPNQPARPASAMASESQSDRDDRVA